MKADKKEIILDAAERLMMKTSQNDISVSLIAKEAGIGKGSIYYYFKSKEEIMYAVIERGYRKALHEYFSCIDSQLPAIEKIKMLFFCTIKKEFNDNRENLFRKLHVNEDVVLHNYMKHIALAEMSPVLEKLLLQGIEEGSIHTDTPKESAEMIVAVLSFILDGTIFENDIATYNKLKVFANVLNTCLSAEKGSFDFLFDVNILQS
ncbi:MAG: TetR/AcrR family transcriptional regulator [Oscillospiraceae bacterium]